MSDIDRILKNLGVKERETLIEIALSMAKDQQAGYTGATCWVLHYSQGAIGDVHHKTERSLFRGRRVRSQGVV